MPAHNTVRFLPAAIESILAQTLREFEFIIVDDASTDGSGDVIRAYAGRDPRIRVLINERNQGFVRSRNRGIESARAPLIANMDSDDIALPERLERQCALMDENPGVGVCGGDVILIDEHDREIGLRRYRTDDAGLRARLFLFNPFAQPATMLRARVIEQVGLYDPDLILADDLDLWFRIGARFQLANVGVPLLKYRLHRNQATSKHLRAMQQRVFEVRTRARGQYGYRPSVLSRIGCRLEHCASIIPAQHGVAVFNWLRSKL
jgi:glycosyltransferase involved in cell wall biosynthesis